MDPNTEVKPATPTPTAPESPPPAAETPSVPAAEEKLDGGSELFSDLAADTSDEEPAGEVKPPETPPQSTTPPPAAEVKPEAAKPPVETPPAPVETPPASAVPPQATPTPETPPTPVPTEEERKAQYAKDRAAAIARLTESYTIPEDLAPVLISEPEKALPQLMAQMHARVMENVVQFMHQQLPYFVRNVSTMETANARAAQAFFNEWPELKDEKFHQTVARVLAGYRQVNPNAKMEEVIREGGVAALVALRLPIPERVLQRHNVEKPDATKPASFTPAPPGATRPPTPKSDNIFTVLAEAEVE